MVRRLARRHRSRHPVVYICICAAMRGVTHAHLRLYSPSFYTWFYMQVLEDDAKDDWVV